mgnify:CR=1 FL=1
MTNRSSIWPSLIKNHWRLSEMGSQRRRTHVIKHQFNIEERWWEISHAFSKRDYTDFRESAKAEGCTIWFPPPHCNDDSWLDQWPAVLTSALDQAYQKTYMPCTVQVLSEIDDNMTVVFTEETKDNGKNLLIYSKRDLLVVLVEVDAQKKRLYWATSYRPMFFNQQKVPKRLKRFVRNLKEAQLY